MKNLFTRLSILLMAATLFGLTSCKDDDKEKLSIVGIWKEVNEESSHFDEYWEIKESGEINEYIYVDGYLDGERHATYTYDGKTLVINGDIVPVDEIISLSSNRMSLLNENGYIWNFERVSSLPKSKSYSVSNLAGYTFTGEDPDFGEISITFGGSAMTFYFDGLTGTYTLSGNTITLKYDGMDDVETISIKGPKELVYYDTVLTRQ